MREGKGRRGEDVCVYVCRRQREERRVREGEGKVCVCVCEGGRG